MYAPFHRFLHWQPIYPYIHKHHHRHLAPHRGLDDAINTHPFELLVGSYMHMWATALIDLAGVPQHIVSIFLFGAGSLVQSGLYWLCILGLALPGLAVTVRRLHDTNRSGWWYAIVLTIIGAIPLTIWFCEEGTQGDNKYGPR
jgi:hypothetical protein